MGVGPPACPRCPLDTQLGSLLSSLTRVVPQRPGQSSSWACIQPGLRGTCSLPPARQALSSAQWSLQEALCPF